MDKLQWFKFDSSSWMMGKIQRCEEITQARFIRLCSLYWSKHCEMTIDDAVIEIDQIHFDTLKSKKIITIDSNNIYISFLDEQYLEIKEDQKEKSTSGIVGNLKRWHKDIYDRFLAKEISLEKAIKLSKIIEKSSLPDSPPIATQSQNIADKTRIDKNRQEENREEKIREEYNSNESFEKLEISPPAEKIDFDKLQKYFNENCGTLAKIKTITEARKKRINTLQKKYGKDLIMICIKKTKDSSFLQGDNHKNWVASFDWIFKPENFIKIIEDNYGNRENTRGNNSTKTDAQHKESAINAVNALFGRQ